MLTKMLFEVKQKFFWARWRDKILSRQRAPQKPFFGCTFTFPFPEPIFDKFCRVNALEKSFAWLQTALLEK